MFTGIIEATGRVQVVTDTPKGRKLRIDPYELELSPKIGASIAINGCCTTIVEFIPNGFEVELMAITLERTNLGRLSTDDRVNLERPLKMGDELGGHLVQGHVEGVGEVKAIIAELEQWRIELTIPPELVRYVIKTGSLAIDGVSLTVADVINNRISVGIIPHTRKATIIADYKVGTLVNIETDLFAKYVEKIVGATTIAPLSKT